MVFCLYCSVGDFAKSKGYTSIHDFQNKLRYNINLSDFFSNSQLGISAGSYGCKHPGHVLRRVKSCQPAFNFT